MISLVKKLGPRVIVRGFVSPAAWAVVSAPRETHAFFRGRVSNFNSPANFKFIKLSVLPQSTKASRSLV